MLKAKIFNSPEKCMAGAELRRLREARNLSRLELAGYMDDWAWYRQKVEELEKRDSFCLGTQEMTALLKALDAKSF